MKKWSKTLDYSAISPHPIEKRMGFLYHEKSTRRQQISYLIGACSVILMNL